MAIPFNIPNNQQSQQQPTQNPAANNSSESDPNNQNANQPELPQFESFDSEILIQAFYEAICRCAQESQLSPPMSPSSPNHSQFQYNFPFNWNEQSPSTSTDTTPRQSFRRTSRSRHSQRSYGQNSEVGDEEEVRLDNSFQYENMNMTRDQMQEFASQLPQPKRFKSSTTAANKQKPKKESKITSFVIGALQYVIDTLRDPKSPTSSKK